MHSFRDQVLFYQQLIEEGKYMFLIDQLYDDDIVQVENNDAPLVGKKLLVENERKNLLNVNDLHCRVDHMVWDENTGIVMGEMTIEFSTPENKKKILNEAFLQKWRGGKIVYQKFFYGG